MRERHPSLGRPRFFQGRRIRGSAVEDLAWFRPDGQPMAEEEWETPPSRRGGLGEERGWARAIAMRLGGKALEEVDAEGNRVIDDDLFLLLNGHYEPVTFRLPVQGEANAWTVIVDTASGEVDREERVITAGADFEMPARPLVLLRR